MRSEWPHIILAFIVFGCTQPQPVDLGVPVVNSTIAEDIFYFTWAKCRFNMKAPRQDVILSFYAYQYNDNTKPLDISVNDSLITYSSDEGRGQFMWHSTTVPRRFLIDGINEIIFKSDTPSSNSWAIAIEHADQPQGSSKSTNRGKSWYSRNLGYNFSIVGQYAIRLIDAKGNILILKPAEPEIKPIPRVVMTSGTEDLIKRGGEIFDFVDRITLNVSNNAEGDILQVRFGAAPETTAVQGDQKVQFWTFWKTVDVIKNQGVITPVRLRYLQWRILNGVKRSGSDPRVEVSVGPLQETVARGQFKEFSFKRVFKVDDIFTCLRDAHIEMDIEASGARLRRGEIVKDEDGNAQINIDRTAFEASDSLNAPWWMGEPVTDTIWIKKELEVENPKTDRAYLMFFYELWAHSPRKELYLYSEEGSPAPLHVSINGVKLDPIPPNLEWKNRTDDWRLVEFPRNLIKPGLNEVIIHTEKGGDWRFAYENSVLPDRSARSTDGGKTWDRNRLGENANDNGEYLIRFWLDRYHGEGMVWSMPISMWEEGKSAWLKKVKDLAIEVTTEGDEPPGTKIVVEVRFGVDLIPDSTSWTDWILPSQSKSLSLNVLGEGFHYMQWRARLSTTSRLVTPMLTSVMVQVKGNHEIFEDEKQVTIKTIKTPRLRLSSYSPRDNSYENELLKMLREQYNLDEIVKEAKTDLEKLLMLSAWVYEIFHTPGKRTTEQQKQYGIDNRVTHWLPNNALWELDILDRGYGHLERRYGLHCHEYAHAFVGCCQALGYMARPLLTWAYAPIYGHCFPEVWSTEYDKWVIIDPMLKVYYLRDNVVPMNARELREAQFDSLLYKRISIVWTDRDFALPKNRERSISTNARETPKGYPIRGYDIFSIWRRNNYMDEPAPYPIWDGVHTFRWDGRLWYQDPRIPFFSEFSHHTTRWDDMYWGVNECFIKPEYCGNGIVRVELSHNMPYFKCFEVCFDGKGEWKKYTGDFLWKLNTGENSIEVRPVNLYGISGSSSSLIMLNRR